MKKIFRYIKAKISNFKYNWGYIGVLNSPFVGLELKWYFGEIKHGTPYFLPRRWVKCTFEDGVKAWDRMSVISQESYLRKQSKESWIKNYANTHTKTVPIKYFGFDYTTLGWKTKWGDYRFEWSPSISIVIFGKQLFITIIPKMGKTPEDTTIRGDIYWEAYLTYKYRTDKSKSKHERLEQTMKLYSCTWGNEEMGYRDYYPLILKDKYIK
jgi:hypothetical protein